MHNKCFYASFTEHTSDFKVSRSQQAAMRAARHKLHLASLLCIYTHTYSTSALCCMATKCSYMRLSVLYMCLVVTGALWRQLAQSGAIVFLYVSVSVYMCLSLLMCVCLWQVPLGGSFHNQVQWCSYMCLSVLICVCLCLYVSVCAYVCLVMAGALWWQFPQSGAMVRLDGAWIRQGPPANQL